MPKPSQSQKSFGQELDLRTNLLSLISQNQTKINVEILLDNNFGINYELHRRENDRGAQNPEHRKMLQLMRSKLLCYVCLKSKDDFTSRTQVGWISDNQLLLTLNN